MKVAIANGYVLARSIHAVLHGPVSTDPETLREKTPDAILLLSGGVQLPTGRPFPEVAEEVENACSDEAYIRNAMEHIFSGVQVRELQAPRGPVAPVAGDAGN